MDYYDDSSGGSIDYLKQESSYAFAPDDPVVLLSAGNGDIGGGSPPKGLTYNKMKKMEGHMMMDYEGSEGDSEEMQYLSSDQLGGGFNPFIQYSGGGFTETGVGGEGVRGPGGPDVSSGGSGGSRFENRGASGIGMSRPAMGGRGGYAGGNNDGFGRRNRFGQASSRMGSPGTSGRTFKNLDTLQKDITSYLSTEFGSAIRRPGGRRSGGSGQPGFQVQPVPSGRGITNHALGAGGAGRAGIGGGSPIEGYMNRNGGGSSVGSRGTSGFGISRPVIGDKGSSYKPSPAASSMADFDSRFTDYNPTRRNPVRNVRQRQRPVKAIPNSPTLVAFSPDDPLVLVYDGSAPVPITGSGSGATGIGPSGPGGFGPGGMDPDQMGPAGGNGAGGPGGGPGSNGMGPGGMNPGVMGGGAGGAGDGSSGDGSGGGVGYYKKKKGGDGDGEGGEGAAGGVGYMMAGGGGGGIGGYYKEGGGSPVAGYMKRNGGGAAKVGYVKKGPKVGYFGKGGGTGGFFGAGGGANVVYAMKKGGGGGGGGAAKKKGGGGGGGEYC